MRAAQDTGDHARGPMQACGHINAAADFGPWLQGERILRELVCGMRPCGANATDPLIDRATA